jgi:hypothetical protein
MERTDIHLGGEHNELWRQELAEENHLLLKGVCGGLNGNEICPVERSISDHQVSYLC